MKTAHILLITAIGVATVWSCKKEESSTNSPTPDVPSGGSSFATYFANNIADATQTFSVDASLGGQRMGIKGTQLLFEPGAFVYADGTPVTGQVTVSLVEVLSMGDMILLNKQTVGNDNGTLRMLRSGGAINVYAEQGGSEVQITPSGLVARIPTNVGDPAMTLFSGREDELGNMIWDRIDSAIVDVDPAYYDSTDYTYTFPYYFSYQLNAPNLNWINCDYFPSSSNTTIVTAVPSSSVDSMRVWVAIPSANAVVAGYINNGNFVSAFGIPVGTSVVVIALRDDTDGYSSAFHTVTVTPNIEVPLVFSPTTLEAFEAAVNAL